MESIEKSSVCFRGENTVLGTKNALMDLTAHYIQESTELMNSKKSIKNSQTEVQREKKNGKNGTKCEKVLCNDWFL